MKRRCEEAEPEGSKRCSRCVRSKPLGQFYKGSGRDGLHGWCKACVRVGVNVRMQDPEVKASRKAYRARPEVKAAIRAHDAGRYRARAEEMRRRRATPLGKLGHARSQAKYRLKSATDRVSRATIAALIRSYDREIAKIRREMDGDRAYPRRGEAVPC